MNGKVLIGSSVNLLAILNRYKSGLKTGSCRNAALQREWKGFCPEAFEFKELEILEPKDDPMYDPSEDLRVLEELWVEKLNPCRRGSMHWIRPNHFLASSSSFPNNHLIDSLKNKGKKERGE